MQSPVAPPGFLLKQIFFNYYSNVYTFKCFCCIYCHIFFFLFLTAVHLSTLPCVVWFFVNCGVYLLACGPVLWQRAHWPVCSGSMLIRCCSCPDCEGHGNGSSQSCEPEMRPPQCGPVRCASAVRSGGTSAGSDLAKHETHTNNRC